LPQKAVLVIGWRFAVLDVVHGIYKSLNSQVNLVDTSHKCIYRRVQYCVVLFYFIKDGSRAIDDYSSQYYMSRKDVLHSGYYL
jgi:hypothetical protein